MPGEKKTYKIDIFHQAGTTGSTDVLLRSTSGEGNLI